MISCELEKIYACLPRTERGQFIVLGSDPKGKHVLYANGNSVIIRNLEDSSDNDIYTQHSSKVTVAKYSPSGFYIASGDINGKIRIWDTTQKEHILKAEYQPFSGKICDISWSSDNSKIAIGGQGREKFGAVINIETGTNVGEVSGMAKCVNNLDLKPTRPFRLATSSEDGVVAYLEGPPFKFKTNHQLHTNFANCLRYSPTGEVFVSAGADGKIFMFDGKTGEHVGEVGNPAHKGGIYSITFNADGKYLFSAGGDKTIKVWSIDATNYKSEFVREHVFGSHIDNIQVGCVSVADKLVCVSLSGELNVFKIDELTSTSSGDAEIQPLSHIQGHQKPLTSLQWSSELEKLISTDSDGQVMLWSIKDGKAAKLSVEHSNQIQSSVCTGESLTTVGVDDKLIVTSFVNTNATESIKLDSQPRKLSYCAANEITAVACYKELVLTKGTKILSKLAIDYESVCIALSPSGKLLIAGGEQSNKLFIYRVDSGHQLVEINKFELLGSPRDLKFTEDGQLLCCGDSERKVSLFKVDECNDQQVLTAKHNEHWKYHTGRVSCVSLSPNSKLVASGSLDCSIIVWSVDKPNEKLIVKNAHPMSNIVDLTWADDNTIFSAGHDGNIKKWKVLLN